ncbi:MAG: DUF2384 domain-containing protein [Burkholderiaceae bacterium]|nr:DUF2384 domain-containing protein [Burkholderiaceae bacterium]
MANPVAAPSAAPGPVLTKAAFRAGELLGLTHSALARVVGLSPASISRMAAGRLQLEPGTKPAELALLLVRLYRSLDALVGNDDAMRRRWMDSFNQAFNQPPRQAIESVEGLVRVVRYLDGARALS